MSDIGMTVLAWGIGNMIAVALIFGCTWLWEHRPRRSEPFPLEKVQRLVDKYRTDRR